MLVDTSQESLVIHNHTQQKPKQSQKYTVLINHIYQGITMLKNE